MQRGIWDGSTTETKDKSERKIRMKYKNWTTAKSVKDTSTAVKKHKTSQYGEGKEETNKGREQSQSWGNWEIQWGEIRENE